MITTQMNASANFSFRCYYAVGFEFDSSWSVFRTTRFGTGKLKEKPHATITLTPDEMNKLVGRIVICCFVDR